MSNTKLGLLVFWPTFWTGFPIKLVICLLLLAGGLRPWKGLGLEFLLVLSIPIDIWALGLCGRTVLLERLKVDPKPGLGLRLWWKWALFSVIYLPILYLTVGAVTSVAKAVTHSIVDAIKANVWEIPVAEQITLELVLWGSVATVVLVLLIIGWFYGLGALANREVKAAERKEKNFEEIVHFWDRIRIPSDQGLLLTAFTGAGLVLVFLFWGLLPETTPHPHEEYEYTEVVKVEPPVKPKKVLKQAEAVLKRAKATITELEKKEGEEGEAKKTEEGDNKAAKTGQKTEKKPAGAKDAAKGKS